MCMVRNKIITYLPEGVPKSGDIYMLNGEIRHKYTVTSKCSLERGVPDQRVP